ncbi:hypothetical protein DFA_05729 [Cavenderia fasciculata]|uniref:peptidylprolyl isomerase n=1 Tax=Cavenderia fasciculata TaxID=261658 RepID=F4PM95_CACFS|nr:uncharacterized protein DFA_05729 [Cavenderia fasciculata]EGG23595.1 hypothetical protein DFA_05729 [Cavenderia fasciculata]|eukprot:XP_004361446.1 hypothetical protein DFA_05729 [Cavenderia fasciculata]
MTSPQKKLGIHLDNDGCLIKRVLKDGSGDQVPSNAIVSILYEAYLSNGHLFDSNVQLKGTPFTFQLGTHASIDAVELAVKSMRVGEEAEIVSTQRYAFGKHGLPPFIPPNTSVIYKIQLISFKLDTLHDYNSFQGLISKSLKEKDRGNNYFNQQKFKLAMKYYIKGIWILGDPNYTLILNEDQTKIQRDALIVLYLNLATCNIKLMDGKRALTNCEKILELGGSSAKFYFRMSQAYSLNRQFESAKRCIVQAIRLEPSDSKLRDELDKIKVLLGE